LPGWCRVVEPLHCIDKADHCIAPFHRGDRCFRTVLAAQMDRSSGAARSSREARRGKWIVVGPRLTKSIFSLILAALALKGGSCEEPLWGQ
jgi:hypothetical protein